MTRTEAIKVLENMPIAPTYGYSFNDISEALYIAIEALLMATDALKLGIVRCGECIDYQNGECKSNLLHWLMDGNVAEVAFRPNNDFYCKYGLRKDGRIE